jgi:hypothetical protein
MADAVPTATAEVATERVAGGMLTTTIDAFVDRGGNSFWGDGWPLGLRVAVAVLVKCFFFTRFARREIVTDMLGAGLMLVAVLYIRSTT